MKIGSINNFYNKNSVFFRANEKETYYLNAREQLFVLNRSLIPDFTFELKEKVDGDRLQDSVKEAIELHPFYKTSLQRKDNGLFILERNNSTPVVKEYDMETPLTYGTDEFNKFPWLVAYKDKNVIFTASHVIGDGMGVFNFFKTLLRIYFEKGGKQFFNAKKWDYSMVNPEETTKDRYLEFADSKIRGRKTPELGVEIPEELLIDDKKILLLTD